VEGCEGEGVAETRRFPASGMGRGIVPELPGRSSHRTCPRGKPPPPCSIPPAAGLARGSPKDKSGEDEALPQSHDPSFPIPSPEKRVYVWVLVRGQNSVQENCRETHFVGRGAWGSLLEKRSRRPGIGWARRIPVCGFCLSLGRSKPGESNSAKRDRVPGRLRFPLRAASWERIRTLDRAGRRASPGPETRHRGGERHIRECGCGDDCERAPGLLAPDSYGRT